MVTSRQLKPQKTILEKQNQNRHINKHFIDEKVFEMSVKCLPICPSFHVLPDINVVERPSAEE